jgi:hypothetical protein
VRACGDVAVHDARTAALLAEIDIPAEQVTP